MIIFWILAAGLMAVAVLFVVVPLLGAPGADVAPNQDGLNLQVFRQRLDELDADRASGFLDQAQYDSARHDLERELLSDLDGGAPGDPQAAPGTDRIQTRPRDGRAPILALILAIALPVAAVLAYLELGSGGIIPRLEAAGADAAAGMGGSGGTDAGAMASLETLSQGLAERLAKDPDNLDGWLMLGRTYLALGQQAKALDALEHAYKLAPRQPDALVGYAQALAATAGNRLDGRPAELIRTALEIEPKNPGARWLNGVLADQQGRYADAVSAWEGVLAEVDPAGEEAAQMRQMIAEARARGGMPAAAAASPAPGPRPGPAPAAARTEGPVAPAAVARAAIRVKVSLASGLAAAVAPGDTLFVFARAAAGPPMPLAVQRLKVADLPASVTLDDSMALLPAMRLSAFPEVVVGARISKSGQATPASGDLEGQTGPIAVAGTAEVSVTIDKARP